MTQSSYGIVYICVTAVAGIGGIAIFGAGRGSYYSAVAVLCHIYLSASITVMILIFLGVNTVFTFVTVIIFNCRNDQQFNYASIIGSGICLKACAVVGKVTGIGVCMLQGIGAGGFILGNQPLFCCFANQNIGFAILSDEIGTFGGHKGYRTLTVIGNSPNSCTAGYNTIVHRHLFYGYAPIHIIKGVSHCIILAVGILNNNVVFAVFDQINRTGQFPSASIAQEISVFILVSRLCYRIISIAVTAATAGVCGVAVFGASRRGYHCAVAVFCSFTIGFTAFFTDCLIFAGSRTAAMCTFGGRGFGGRGFRNAGFSRDRERKLATC